MKRDNGSNEAKELRERERNEEKIEGGEKHLLANTDNCKKKEMEGDQER